MSTAIPQRPRPAVEYPDSDGRPMAENTLQFQWIVTIKENLEVQFRDDPQVFVAGDLLWYPVEGHPEIRMAPDALVVFGRPKGYRGSYMQFAEGGIAPQVVFEVLSPGNRAGEMERKLVFYQKYGVEEYYVYDPARQDLVGWTRADGVLEEIPNLSGYVSPRLGIRFEPGAGDLRIYRPDGMSFLTFSELFQQRDDARQQAEASTRQAEEATRQAEAERQRAERLAARLRELGVDAE